MHANANNLAHMMLRRTYGGDPVLAPPEVVEQKTIAAPGIFAGNSQISFSESAEVGDIIVVAACARGNDSFSMTGSGWDSENLGTAFGVTAIFHRALGAGESPEDFSLTFSGATAGVDPIIFLVRGASSTSFDSGYQQGVPPAPSEASLTALSSAAVVIGGCFNTATNSIPSVDSGYDDFTDQDGSSRSGAAYSVGSQLLGAGDTPSVAGSVASGAGALTSFVLALQP